MNREGAETYLRLLAEAEMRDPSAPLEPMPWWGGFPAGNTSRRLQVVALALTTVEALEARTAEAILADFDLAVTVRRRGPDPRVSASQAWTQRPAGGISGSTLQAVTARIRARGPGPGMAGPLPPPPAARRGQVPDTLTGSVAAGRPTSGPGQPTGDRPSIPERFVPIGVMVPFHYDMVIGGLYLMAYSHTAGGARLTMMWQPHSPTSLGVPDVALCTVTDDRGRRYQLDFTLGTSVGPRWTGVIALIPDPPGDLRWLDICPPNGTAVRVTLDPAETAGGAMAQVSKVPLSPGEHLLTLIAERLLAEAQDQPRHRRQEMPPSGPASTMAAGLGEVVAALEAAEALAPDSPLPGRLATLCANLTIDVPGLTAPPALDLPEPWFSALAHYHRRRPHTEPSGEEGAAPLATALPELDGIRLVLLGLINALGHTWLYVLARGLTRETHPGQIGMDVDFPLSVWILASGGRWHLAYPAGRHRVRGDEEMLRLRLNPVLPQSATWIEALAAGRSAQARVRLPLRWSTGYD